MKKYNSFLFEKINLDFDITIEILKSLKKSDSVLFKKIINKYKKKLVIDAKKSNDEDLIFILDNIDDISFEDSDKRNLLYSCTTIKCVKKFMGLGIKPKPDRYGRSLIEYLISHRHIFNKNVFDDIFASGCKIKNDNKVLINSLGNYDKFMYFINKGLIPGDDTLRHMKNKLGLLKYYSTKDVLRVYDYLKSKYPNYDFSSKQLSIDDLNFSLFKLAYSKMYDILDIYYTTGQVISDDYKNDDYRKIKYMLENEKRVEVYKTLEHLSNSGLYHFVKDKIMELLEEYKMLKKISDFNL